MAHTDSIGCSMHKNDDSEATGMNRLATQVGGHHNGETLGFYDFGEHILKTMLPPPRGLRELKFYQDVFQSDCSDSDLINLRPFIPKFFGTEQRGESKLIKLANLTAGILKPCVMDIKMGRVTYDKEATPKKIKSEQEKYPPRKEIGFSITGMILQDEMEFKRFGKDYTRSLSEKTIVSEGLGIFFSIIPTGSRKPMLQGLVTRLKEIERWFLTQRKLSFISCSLLFVYEGIQCKLVNRIASSTKDDNVSELNKSTDSSSQKQDLDYSPRKRSCEDVIDNNARKSMKVCEADGTDLSCYIKKDSSLNNNNSSHMSSFRVDSTSIPKFSVHLIDFAHVFPSTDIDENFLFGLKNLIRSLSFFVEEC